MKLHNLEDLIKANSIYGLQMWACGPYGVPIPFEVLLKTCKPLLKEKVCDVLGLDVDEVISEMSANWEYYFDGECKVLPTATYVINKDARVWVSDARWNGNKQEGGMSETCAYVNLNDYINIDYDYVDKADPNDGNIYYTLRNGSIIKMRASMKTTCFDDNGNIMPNNKRRESPLPHSVWFCLVKKLQVHVGSYFGNLENQYCGDRAFFSTKEECKQHINKIFSNDANNRHKLDQLAKDYKKLASKKADLLKQLANIEKEAEKINEEYKSINGSNIE